MSENGIIKSKKTLTLEAAKLIASRAAWKARELNVGGAIAVVDGCGHLLYFERLDGTMPGAVELATGKACTAILFQRPTQKLEYLIQHERICMLGINGALPSYTPLMGGHPIVLKGEVIGAIAVAGAQTGENDEIISQFAAEFFEVTAETTST